MPITAENSVLVADQAKSYIVRNIPVDAPGKSSGILALGIVSVLVVDQSMSYTPSGPFLRVQFEVQGNVIADSNFDKESLDFSVLINQAIRSNNGEFLRLVEPLVVPGKSNDPSKGKSNKTVVIVVISILVVSAMVLLFFAINAYLKWRQNSPDKDCLPGNNKKVPPIALVETIGSDRSDSVDEQSIYTLRETVPSKSMHGSAIMHVENGESSRSKYLGWSFSMSSEGDGDGNGNDSGREFDTRSTDDDPHRLRYTIENVDDISIGKDGDVFEDIDLNDNEDEDAGGKSAAAASNNSDSSHSIANATIGEVFTSKVRDEESEEEGEMEAPGRLGIADLEFAPVTDDISASRQSGIGQILTSKVGDEESEEEGELDMSGRLSIADMEEFDKYLSGLPAPYQFQSRGKHTRKRKPLVL